MLALPRETAVDILKRAHAKQQFEKAQMQKTLDGTLTKPWIDAALKDKGCVWVD